MENTGRNSSIELLRILTMCGVILLHYNNPLIGGAFQHVKIGSMNYYFLYIMESLCCCAVNLYMIISGYFLSRTTKRSMWNVVNLLIQVIVFRIGIHIVSGLLGQSQITMRSIFLCLIPNNYFVILYVVTYIVSPYINILLEELSAKQRRKFIIVIMLLFSIWPTLVDISGEILGVEWIGLSTIGMYGNQWGYTVVNFLLMYIIGAYINKNGLDEKKRTKGFYFICILVAVTILTGWAFINERTGYFTERSAWTYCNPVVIFVAVMIFLMFLQIKVNSRVINQLAKGSFTCFLLQNYFLRFLQIPKIVQVSFPVMLLHLLGTMILVYGMCYVAYIVYKQVTNPIFNKLEKVLNGKIDISVTK